MVAVTGYDDDAAETIAAHDNVPMDPGAHAVRAGLRGLACVLTAAARAGFAPITQAYSDIECLLEHVPAAPQRSRGELLQIVACCIDYLLLAEGFEAAGEEPHDFGLPDAPNCKVFYVRRAEFLLYDAIDAGESVILATTQDVRRFGRAVMARHASGGEGLARRVFHWTTASGLFEAVHDNGAITYIQAGTPELYTAELECEWLSVRCAESGLEPNTHRSALFNQGLTPVSVPTPIENITLPIFLSEPTLRGRKCAYRVVVDDIGTDGQELTLEPDLVHFTLANLERNLCEVHSRNDRFPRTDKRGRPQEAADSMHALISFVMTRQAEGALFVLYDGEVFLDKELIGGAAALTGAFLRDACARLRRGGKGTQILVLSTPVTLPPSLSPEIAYCPLPLPSRFELLAEIRRRASWIGAGGAGRLRITDELRNVVDAAAGMTMSDAIRVLREAERKQIRQADQLVSALFDAKRTAIKRSAALELIDHAPPSELKLGGMDRFWTWLSVRGRVFRFPEQAVQAGIDRRPKGVLILGVPGTGKSLAAKLIAREWNVPLVRLDLGAVQNRFVGASEERMREALTTVQAMSPCVLWIDEIDKGIVQGEGTSSHSADLNTRATLLTWLQENDSAVFVVATANRFANLPPELTRAGRFDARFFFGCPDLEGRRQILQIHLQLRSLTHIDEAEQQAVAHCMHGFTGAEIEQAVLDGLYLAFAAERPVCGADLIQAAGAIKPLIRASGRALDEVWMLIEQGRVELASEHFLNRVDVARLIDPQFFSPMYCALDGIVGWERHAERATRILMRDQYGARAAVALDTGDDEWVYVHTNLRLNQGDPAPFKFLDRMDVVAANGVFDRLVVEGGLETIWYENACLRERFHKYPAFSAYEELFQSIDDRETSHEHIAS